MQVIKRDGRIVEFDKDKIYHAIIKAFEEVDGQITSDAKRKATNVSTHIEAIDKKLTVERIQDIVEAQLMNGCRKDVAKAYILYRAERTKHREYNTKLMKLVLEKLTASNVQNQNANVDEHSFGGRIGEASDAILKQMALDNCMSDIARDNHLNNEIYTHDLNSYPIGSHNCLSIPFDKLLESGFDTRQTDVRPANSINTAFQLVAVIFQLQSLMQFGGVSATHLDWTMVRYVKKSFAKHYILSMLKSNGEFYELDILNMNDNEIDEWFSYHKQEYLDRFNLTENDLVFSNKDNLDIRHYQCALFDTRKETYQAVEGMYHNLNTLQSRSGNQLPFTSINYGTCTEPEGRLVIKALLEVSIKGIGKLHKTSIFPCGIFQLMKGVNRKEGEPNYDLYMLALKSTSLRLYPNYVNCDWSGNVGYDRNNPKTFMSTMG